MKNKLIAASFLSVALFGCSDSAEPLSQKALYEELETLESAWKKAKSAKNELLVEEKEQSIKSFLSVNRTAENWVGKVEKVSQNSEGNISVKLAHRNQNYTLIIVDPSAKQTARNLTNNETLLFSGELGKERSFTIGGALDNPEFSFPPVSFKLKGSDAVIVQQQEWIEQYFTEINTARLKSQLREKVLSACQSAAKDMLVKPSSADFSILDLGIKEVSENTWLYVNTVEATNGFGAEIEFKVMCSAQTSIQDGHPKILKAVAQLN
ncbi:hypothetical protein OPW41_18220 [Vibrio europaeus]|uniref:hypothetical protein n=1 Tax=Vibrio europaeus TaxID=300876 RepID=UPI00233F6FE8|nr:hypothetical protein [Vibrio europaeus]MDC5753840.1 hypothetical protein [Vibrio europaeus]MDC5776752.1 hypothetical protein [Vibrio europaeus]MDC5796768.1 hypothetical protein [Vibrio europaeus]MDC5801765.1 hypothetical protein [Vibrio europaeus]MDC5815738.1 hypothetical protein [Vibrio europaeus]